MRSSKSRSRSKSNRPRPLGNVVNRVFDSSGPEGKVRGTPQQIIEKYLHLARDAQLSNDRVAAEAFLQHAEHYTRMLSEAQREMAAEQEARQAQQQANQQHHQNQQPRRDDHREQRREQPRYEEERAPEPEAVAEVVTPTPEPVTEQPTLDLVSEAETGLVDTPEESNKQRRPRAPRAPKPAVEGEAPRRQNTRRPRKKPEGEGGGEGGPREAAE